MERRHFTDGSRSSSGSGAKGGWVRFDTSTDRVVTVKLALSYTGLAGARNNLAGETNAVGFSFDSVRATARDTWNTKLHKAEVDGGTTDRQVAFYTSLYHSLLHPNVASDVDGRYLGFDNVVRTAPQPQPVNLALNKPATGSTPCAAAEGPEKAVNGSVSGGNTDKFCTATAPRFLQVDLGAARAITSFEVVHAGGGGESASYNTRDFTLQVSTDATTWSTVVTVTANTAGTTTHPVSVSGRYVKLNIGVPTQTTDAAARIYEFRVFGT